MLTEEEALQLIQDSMDSLARSGTITETEAEITEETVLLGSDALLLDSIGFVTFITDMEDRMEQKTNLECYLVLNEIDEFNISNPNLTVKVLMKYLVKLVQDLEETV